jgi:hypothetical protein
VLTVVSGAACADATAPMHSIDGVWQGTAGDESVTLSLTMHGDQSVTGYGYDSSASAGASAFPVRATVKAGFSGQFSNAETLHGSVDLAHFSGDVQLSRISSTPAPAS